ncbi:ATP-binding cassette domain-containing protein, partial [Bacteroidota bacterium]
MIEISGLIKNFGKTPVLKGINLSIGSGKATAIVGPNSSGKTTMIKSVLGLVKPTSGFIEVDGVNTDGNFNYRNKIGYMPQIARYPENLTA